MKTYTLNLTWAEIHTLRTMIFNGKISIRTMFIEHNIDLEHFAVLQEQVDSVVRKIDAETGR